MMSLGCAAQEQPDSLRLNEVTVEGTQLMGRSGADATVRLTAELADFMPRFFGETDLMRVLRLQGGVSAPGDYASGINIDGMDGASTSYTLNGVPVHFPYHFGGIFSVFNTRQYPRLTLSRSMRDAGAPPAIGGVIELAESEGAALHAGGNANLGLTASSAALRLPLRRVEISASARVSYIDALMRKFVNTDRLRIGYDFYDADLSAIYRGKNDVRFHIFAHHNGDRLRYDDGNYGLDTHLRWHNTLAGANWQKEGFSASVYYSEMSNRLMFAMQSIRLRMPSGIRQFGVNGSWKQGRFSAGVRADMFDVKPQAVSSSGIGDVDTDNPAERCRAMLSSLWGNFTVPLSGHLMLRVGLEANGYFTDEYRTVNLDPRLRLTLRLGAGALTFHAGRYHQYIHQVGFTDIGMPSNFKMAASRTVRPQQSLNLAMGYATPLPVGLRASADVYFRKVTDVPEYTGAVLDILSDNYSPEMYIMRTRGFNAGTSATLSYDNDPVSASATYSFGIARRHQPGSGVWFTAASEVRHALSASTAWRIDSHWRVSATFSFSCGRPVTPIRSAYVVGQYVAVEYGRRNSARLPDYHRLDLAASYSFSSGALRHTFGASLINAYGHRNAEMQKFSMNLKDGTLSHSYVSSLYRFLPSLNYTLSF